MEDWMRDAVSKLVGEYADEPLQKTGMLNKVEVLGSLLTGVEKGPNA